MKEQTKFEKMLFRKTVKAQNEIIMLDGLTILYRSSVDIYIYVMGSSYENELILLSALECLFSSLNSLLRKEFEKKALLGSESTIKVNIMYHTLTHVLADKMDLVLLAIDEICDNGILLESDCDLVVSRAQLRMDDLPLAEQTVAQVQAGIKAKMDATSALVQSAKEQLKWSLLK